MNDPVVSVPAWSAYPWLRAGFSTRLGGVSTAYGPGDLNLGWTDSDSPANVAANRAILVQAVAPGAQLVTVRQVHSAVTQIIDSTEVPLSTPEGKAAFEGDGLMTALPGLLLGAQTADCTPILLADTKKRVVAAFHAGWRGTVAGIVERGVHLMRQHYGSQPADMIAAVGPAIGVCCYQVGGDLRAQFEAAFPYGAELFQGDHLNLHEANRRQLLAAGLPAANISMLAECTACTRVNGRRKYFSHRDEKGFTGRMISVIGIAG